MCGTHSNERPAAARTSHHLRAAGNHTTLPAYNGRAATAGGSSPALYTSSHAGVRQVPPRPEARMSARVPIAVIAVCAAVLADSLGAQRAAPEPPNANIAGRELVGLVRDANGVALEGATVQIAGFTARTNELGTFRMWTADIDTVTISIRRLGFSAVSALIATRGAKWDTVVVEMERLPQRLAAAEVKAALNRQRLGLRDFEDRRSRGGGQYVTRDDLMARNAGRPSDVLREVKGVRIVRARGAVNGVRFAQYSIRQPNCTPSLWVDGQLAPGME